MKIVIDSNVFISAFFWNGNPQKVFERVINRVDDLFISDEILKEVFEVMSRKKFNIDKQIISDYLKIIELFSIKVYPEKNDESICRDITDNKILLCGFWGNTDYIITGDSDLLVLKEYKKIRIVNPKEYIEIV